MTDEQLDLLEADAKNGVARPNTATVIADLIAEVRRLRDATTALRTVALEVFPEGSPILNERGNAEVTYDEWNAMRAALSGLEEAL